MSKNERSVYERLDSIEEIQSETKEQNEEMIELLRNLKNQNTINQNVNDFHQDRISQQQILKSFVKSSKKEHVWFGTPNEFNNSKRIVNVICVFLIAAGVLSTILTSIALKLYSTFSLFENIWLIFACIMFLHSIHSKKRMQDIDLKGHSTYIFMQDEDGTWRDTNKEKKRYKWFRRISYISVVANIIVIWTESSGSIAVSATVLELAFLGLSIGLYFAYTNLFCMYGSFILFTGSNLSNTETVTLVFDVISKKLAPYSEYKEKMKDYL